MDNRKSISLKVAKQIVYEAMYAAKNREQLRAVEKTMRIPISPSLEDEIDEWFERRINVSFPPEQIDPTLPKFAKMGNTSLRLIGQTYYRDAGDWGVQYRYVDGVLVSWAWGRGKPQLHKVPLVKITEEEWREGNGQYAPETLEDE